MWVPTKSNVLGRFEIYPNAYMHGIGIFKKRNLTKNRYDLHTTRCCSFRMLFTFYIQPNIKRKSMKKIYILRTGAH